MAGEPVVCPAARVVRVHDADTYLMLLDFHGRGLDEDGCETVWIRLRDYSGREVRDTADQDPKGLGRVTGPVGKSIAEDMLAKAKQITVELLGPDMKAAESFARLVGWVWVDGQSLGELLAAEHAVAAGGFVGGRRS